MKEFKSSARINQVDKFGDIVFDKFSNSFPGVVDMSARTADFVTGSLGIHQTYTPNFFILIPETNGTIAVELVGSDEGTVTIITANQVAENMGKPLLYKVRTVKVAGTTAKFTIVW